MNERLFQAIQRLQHWVAEYGDKKPKVFIEDVTLLVLEAKSQPRRRPRPTVPGMWLCFGDPFNIAQRFTQEQIDAGAPFGCKEVFGPIPEPPENIE